MVNSQPHVAESFLLPEQLSPSALPRAPVPRPGARPAPGAPLHLVVHSLLTDRLLGSPALAHSVSCPVSPLRSTRPLTALSLRPCRTPPDLVASFPYVDVDVLLPARQGRGTSFVFPARVFPAPLGAPTPPTPLAGTQGPVP